MIGRRGRLRGGGGSGLLRLIASAAIWTVVGQFVRQLPPAALVLVGIAAAVVFVVFYSRGRKA